MEMDESQVEQAFESMLSFVTTFVLKSALLLKIPDIIENAGPKASLTLHEIVAKLPSKSPNLHYLSRILAYLSAKGIFIQTKCPDNPSDLRYALTNSAKRLYVRDNNPSTVVPLFHMLTHPILMASWHHLHECVIEDCHAFEKAHGKDLWTYGKEDPLVSNIVNDGMSTITIIWMEQILSSYDGFKEVKTVVDVGGGNGTALTHIVKAYPHIHGINFDLPHVVQTASSIPGIENVGGSMFESIPAADAIFMKNVLIDWDEESCARILENCHRALPDNGRFILAEIVAVEESKRSKSLEIVLDLVMIALANGGKKRSEQEWTRMVEKSGFNVIKIVALPGILGELKIIEAIKV